MFVIISINPITISRTNNYNTVNEGQSFDILNPRNNPPIVNRTFPTDSATNIPISGIPINAEIYDSDDDDLWVEIWSNYTGEWIEYASYDVALDWKNRTWSNESSIIFVDYNRDGLWTILDLAWLSDRDGWGQSGNWGFMYNISVTDDWGMTNYSTTYYWSVNVTDNFTWTNETYHFSTKSIGFDVVYVDDDYNESTPGWGYDHFDSIQDGVDAVNENGTVYIYNGTYYENIVIDKKLNLTGEDSNSTIIDGGGNDDVIHVSSDGVSIIGFTIQNSGFIGYPNYDAGIDIRFNNNTIRDNIIKMDCLHGMYLRSSSNNFIDGNYIYENYVGIFVMHSSNDNLLSNNKVTNNDHIGIRVYQSNSNKVINNYVFSHGSYGIISEDSSTDNLIFHNNLINNTINAYDESTNSWYNSTLGEGNYYDDYTGNDTNGDCIGDTPYNISGGDNQDLYPFMYPNGWINNPPYPPSDPFPEDGAYDVPVDIILNWTGGDPDPCDIVIYDVYFGVTYPPTKKVSNQTLTYYSPLQLEICTKYYWQIVAWDNHGVCTKGPIWSFTTFCVNFPPDMPVIDGPSSGKAGETYIYSFDADDFEGHDIYYFVDWGDETNTSWLGPYESGEKIYINHTWSQKGTYVIMVRAKDVYDAIGDWGTLEVTMPRSKPFFYNSPLLSWLFERFPNAFPILRQLIGL